MPPLVQEGISPHFLKVTNHLELGGSSFFYAEQEDTTEFLAGLLDRLLKAAPKNNGSPLPENFSFKPLFKSLGLDCIKAMGASSRKLSDGRYHSRSFAYIPDGRTGLLNLSGGPAEPFLTHELAPEGTDFVIEFPLQTKDGANEILSTFRDLLPAKEREQFDTSINQKQPPLGLSTKEILTSLGARVALIARINPDQQLTTGKPGTPTFPGIDAAIVIERLNWILDPLYQQFKPLFATPQFPADATENNGVLTIKLRAPVGPAPMDFQPSFRYEPTKNRAILATRSTFLDALLQSKDRLATTPEFQHTWQGLPENGNGCLYVSPRFQSTLLDIVKTSMASASVEKGAQDVITPILSVLEEKLKMAQAFCYSNQSEGTLSVSNGAFSINSSSSQLNSIATVGILSGVLAPGITGVKTQAEQAKSLNNARTIAIALKLYASEHDGKFPVSLDTLISEGFLPKGTALTCVNPVTKQLETWLYDSSLTDSSPATAVLLASKCAFKQKGTSVRLVVYLDGRAEFINETAFDSQKATTLK